MPEADCADSIFDSLPQGGIKKPGRPQQNFSASLCAEKQLVSTHQTVIKVTPLLLNALHSLHCWQEGLLCSCVFSKKKPKPKQRTHNTKQNKTKGHKILWPTICWSTGHGYSADPNAWLHSAGVPCDPSFHGGIQWENRLHEAAPATAVNRLISLLLLQD